MIKISKVFPETHLRYDSNKSRVIEQISPEEISQKIPMKT